MKIQSKENVTPYHQESARDEKNSLVTRFFFICLGSGFGAFGIYYLIYPTRLYELLDDANKSDFEIKFLAWHFSILGIQLLFFGFRLP